MHVAGEHNDGVDNDIYTAGSSELDDALNEIDAGKHPVTTITTGTSPDADPFDEIVREQQHA